jgi:predicted Ser/Thr protein kinase
MPQCSGVSECLDPNAVQDLMANSLDPVTRASVFSHLDTCADCRDLIGVLARETVRDSAEETMQRTALGTGIGAGLESTAAASAAALATVTSLGKPVKTADGEPKKLGRYQLVDRIGAGAMGIVYRARDPELGRDVALKLLKRPEASLTDRLIREARSMAKVNHPNVVGVYDVGVADSHTYIAMELVEGQSLRVWQGEKRRTVPEIVEAYVAAGHGLAAAHVAGIIHRDFKPDNVLVGSDGRIRVTDFGLAAAHVVPSDAQSGDAITDVDLTASGSVLGTPAYMAPEQFTGGNVDSRTDQFNYCVALYEALYGQRPFKGVNFEELGDNVCDGKIRSAPAGSPVSRELRAILLRGLSVRPGDRFPTMDHLLIELGRDRARPWRRTAVASTAIAVVLGLGMVADYTVRDRVEGQIRESFKATGVQVDRAVALLQQTFVASSNVAYLQPQIRDVSGRYDQADFGLGTEDSDTQQLSELHEILASADWVSWTHELNPGPLAICDRKGRLLFTSTDDKVWGADIRGLPAVKRLIEDGKNNSATEVLRADTVVSAKGTPTVPAAKLLGTEKTDDLWVMFARAFAPGGSVGALYLQFSSGAQLLQDIRLDEDMTLALVAPDGTFSPSTVPHGLIRAARAGEIDETEIDGQPYEVQARTITDKTSGKPIAHVVMGRRLGGVLSGLFPGARSVFAILTALAIALALATSLRARTLAGAKPVGVG